MAKKSKNQNNTLQESIKILLFTMSIYVVMLLVFYGGGNASCEQGQGLDDGCVVEYPYLFMLFVPALLLGSTLYIGLLHRKATKRRKRRW